MGGYDERQAIVATVEVYRPSNDAWRSVAALPMPLHHVNVAAARGRLYVVGALRGVNFAATGITLEYDPATDAWRTRASMPSGSERGASAVATIGDRIYVAGGQRGGGGVSDFSTYDPASDSWQSLQNMPTARDHMFGAVVGGMLYVIGGRNAGGLRDEVEFYDPQASRWSVGRPMPTARGGAMGDVVGGKIYVVGGEGNSAVTSGVFDSNEAYDPVTNSWTVLERMRTPRHGTQAVGLNGVLYVPGGANRQNFAAVSTHETFTP